VITFEELMGMFGARQIELNDQPEAQMQTLASRDGRNYAVAGAVAAAVAACIQRRQPERAVPTMQADNLRDCRKMLLLAKAGKTPGHLLEGMACPGGCIGGPGTLMPVQKAGVSVKQFAGHSPYETAADNPAAQPK